MSTFLAFAVSSSRTSRSTWKAAGFAVDAANMIGVHSRLSTAPLKRHPSNVRQQRVEDKAPSFAT